MAIAIDSAYVHDDLQGKALQWKAARWVTSRGPIINGDLWSEILDKLFLAVCTFEWVKVPSHADLAGNEEADKSVEGGRKLSPLYLTVKHQVRMPVTPPPLPDSMAALRKATFGTGPVCAAV